MRLITLGFLEVEKDETVIMHQLLATFTRELFDDSEAQKVIEKKLVNQLSVPTIPQKGKRFITHCRKPSPLYYPQIIGLQ